MALQIEHDIQLGCFDPSLVKYGARKKEAGKATILPETFVSQFEWWVKHYKHMDCEIHINNITFRKMIRK